MRYTADRTFFSSLEAQDFLVSVGDMATVWPRIFGNISCEAI